MKRPTGGGITLKQMFMVGVLLAAGVPIIAISCNADLTVGCEDGKCTSGGLGGSVPCVPDTTDDVDTRGYPRDVWATIKNNCTGCHTDPCVGAPRSWEYFNNTQNLDPESTTGRTWWEQMEVDVDGNIMPQDQAPNFPDCKKKVLDAWFKTCHSAEGCAKGGGTATEPKPADCPYP